jgi:hypothetical protein
MAKKPPPGTGRTGRGAFMAHRAMVRQQLEAGIPALVIFNANRALFPFQYSNFAKYIRRYLPDAPIRPAVADAPSPAKPEQPVPSPASTAATPAPAPSSKPGPIVAEGEARKTFTHDPVPRDLDKLL